MTEIRFYHLTRRRLEDALPELLEKCLDRGWRAVVMAGSDERVEALTEHLWTWREGSFLPHGSARDGEPDWQPIWLTAADEAPNGATVLFLADGASSASIARFDLVCELFEDRDAQAVAAARAHWRGYKRDGHSLTYYQQAPNGDWERKA